MIDTGFDFNSKWSIQPKICATGHKDFSGEGIQDSKGHGTHIAGLIAKYAEDADYCLVIIKFFSSYGDNLTASVKAINYAVEQKVDIINYSAGGVEYSKEEYQAVLKALNASITFVAAAGNEGKGFDKQTYYPALYDDRIIVVGSIDSSNDRLPSSNYGTQVDVQEFGKNVLSILPNGNYGYLTGTSQATAIHTGKIVKHFNKIQKFDRVPAPKCVNVLDTMLALNLNK